MKNENRCKKHRHFCIVALFFPLPTETNRDADHRPVSHTNALCALYRGRTGKHTAGQIFPFFCRCCGKERKAGVTLLYSLFGESASIAFDWSRSARALPSAELPCNSLGGQKPCTHSLSLEMKV